MTDPAKPMDTDPIDWQLLLEQAKQDAHRLGTLLQCYRPFLLIEAESEIGARLRAKCDPEDVVQQTLGDAITAFPQFAGTSEAEFSAWLRRIHQNNLRDALRKLLNQKRDVRHEQPLFPSQASLSFCWNEPVGEQTTPSQRLIRGENAIRLARLLQELKPEWRDAIRMRHLECRPVQEIADELDCSVVAAAGLLKRGLQALRRKMHEDSWL